MSIDKTCFSAICCLEGQIRGAVQALEPFYVSVIHLFSTYMSVFFFFFVVVSRVLSRVYSMPNNAQAIWNAATEARASDAYARKPHIRVSCSHAFV